MAERTALTTYRNSDLRITYSFPRGYNLAGFEPVFYFRASPGEAPLLTVQLIASSNGSATSVVGDSVILTLKSADLAVFGSADIYNGVYDSNLPKNGFVNKFVGGPHTQFIDGSYGEDIYSESVFIDINGKEIGVIVEGGNLAIGASVLLADLNAAVVASAASAQEAEDAAAAAVAATANKLDLNGGNVGGLAGTLRGNIGAVGSVALASTTGGTLVGNQLSAGANLRTQTYREFVDSGDIRPNMFAGTAEQQFLRSLTEAGTSRNGGLGQTAQLPRGETTLTAPFNIPDRVTPRGYNKRGSRLKADAAFVGSYMATVVNGTSSMFDNALVDLTLDCNDVAGLGGVLSSAWQEGGGMKNVLIQKFRTYGVRFQNGFGGAALCEIDQCELFGSSAGASPSAGIRVDQIKVAGAFVLSVSNTTIAGDAAVKITRGIDMVNDSLNARSVHFENCTTGIYLDGGGSHVLENITGLSNVTNLIEIASTFTGSFTMTGCKRDGAAVLLKDNRTGGYGSIAYDTDVHFTTGLPANIGDIIAIGNFDGTSGASPPITNCRGVTSITRTGPGEWTINLAYTLPSGNHMTGVANSRDPNGCARVLLNTASSVQILNTSFGSTKQDVNEVNFVIFRSRLT